MDKIIIIIFVISCLIVVLTRLVRKENFKDNKDAKSDPCSNDLSDVDYLLHMIPHHQVAVDISVLLQKKSKNPVMQNILRILIWTQEYEINLMKHMLKTLSTKVSTNDNMNRNYIKTIANFVKPNKVGISNTYCDPHFFDPEEHMKHIKKMKLTDAMYIHHMIPHHQVAVDMSKKLLKNTKNDFMIYLAYRIIRSQQAEVIILTDLLNKSKIYFESKLL